MLKHEQLMLDTVLHPVVKICALYYEWMGITMCKWYKNVYLKILKLTTCSICSLKNSAI